MVGKVRRSVAGGGRAPGAYRRRRRACRGPRSLRLWPGGGGRKARRGEVAVASRGWLTRPERPLVAVAGISHILEGLGEDLAKTGKFAYPSCAGAAELHACNLLWRLV